MSHLHATKIFNLISLITIICSASTSYAVGAKLTWSGAAFVSYRLEATNATQPSLITTINVGVPTPDILGHMSATITGLTNDIWNFKVIGIKTDNTELSSNVITQLIPPITTTTTTTIIAPTTTIVVPKNLDTDCNGMLNGRDIMILNRAVLNPSFRIQCP